MDLEGPGKLAFPPTPASHPQTHTACIQLILSTCLLLSAKILPAPMGTSLLGGSSSFLPLQSLSLSPSRVLSCRRVSLLKPSLSPM